MTPSHFQFQPQLRGLYVITDAEIGGGHELMARAALAGGARILQLRDKTTPLRQLLPIAEQLRALTRECGALLLINDRLDLALACEADGVHLGDDDFPLEVARRVLGESKIIGVSASNPDLARAAERGGATYLGVGAVFGTRTKLDAGAAIGLETLRAVVDATSLPVAAIGGVEARNLASVLAAGAAMACVISALGKGFDAELSAGENERKMAQTARELVVLADAALEQKASAATATLTDTLEKAGSKTNLGPNANSNFNPKIAAPPQIASSEREKTGEIKADSGAGFLQSSDSNSRGGQR